MEAGGYAGSILYVDLKDGATRKEPLDDKAVERFIGGRGINHKLAHDHIPAQVDPLGPENRIIIGAGPFSGTIIPGCAELLITSKFPLNGLFATASGGGKFPLMLKTSGFDHLVITGRAERPVYLKIHDGDARLCEAGDLWGMDCFETVDALRLRHEPCSVIPIGRAGENLAKATVTFMDKGGTVGSGGLPAVMGSKNLKAIVAVEGTRGIKVADAGRLQKVVQGLLDRMMKWPGRDYVLKLGFSGEISSSQFASAPYDNYSKINFSDLPPKEREQMLALHVEAAKVLACPGCPMADKERITVSQGVYAPMVSYLAGMMVRRWNAPSLPDAYSMSVKYADTLNRHGLCEMNFEGLFSLVVHLYRRGILTPKDTGMELQDDLETRLKLADMTAKREGFGDVMADGILEAARKLGRGIEEYAVHIKGRAPHVEPRVTGLGTMPLTQITDPRGAFPAGGGGPGYVPGKAPGEFSRHGERMGIPQEALDRIVGTDSWNVGRFTRYSQDWYSLWDCLGMCLRAPVSRFYHINTLVELYTALTGLETSPEKLMRGAERAWNLHRILNAKAGFVREDDRAPKAWFVPLQGADGTRYSLKDYYGKVELSEADVNKSIEDYYDERGWDKKTGLPTAEKLEELGLTDSPRADIIRGEKYASGRQEP